MRILTISLGNPEAEVIGITVNKGEDSRDIQLNNTTSHINVPEQDPSCVSRDTIVWDMPANAGKLFEEAEEIVVTISCDPQDVAGYSFALLGGDEVKGFDDKVLLEKAEYIDILLKVSNSDKEKAYRERKKDYEVEDLASKLEEMLELEAGELPDEYRAIAKGAVDDFEKALANNDSFWESYWCTAEFVLKDALKSRKRGGVMRYSDEQLNAMTLDKLKDILTDVINARESYPEDSTNRKALELDGLYLKLDDVIGGLKNIVEKIRVYVMNDTVRKENFADVEICCEDDNYYANDVVKEILDGYSWNDCMKFLEAEQLNLITL